MPIPVKKLQFIIAFREGYSLLKTHNKILTKMVHTH